MKEIFYNTDHSETGYDQSVENEYESSVCHKILHESLSASENEIYIEIRPRIFDIDYYYFTYLR